MSLAVIADELSAALARFERARTKRPAGYVDPNPLVPSVADPSKWGGLPVGTPLDEARRILAARRKAAKAARPTKNAPVKQAIPGEVGHPAAKKVAPAKAARKAGGAPRPLPKGSGSGVRGEAKGVLPDGRTGFTVSRVGPARDGATDAWYALTFDALPDQWIYDYREMRKDLTVSALLEPAEARDILFKAYLADGAAATKAATFSLDNTKAKLSAATTRDEARSALDGMTGPQLREVAKGTGTSLVGVTTKDGIKSRIVEHSVGFKLNSASIRYGSWGDEQDLISGASAPRKATRPKVVRDPRTGYIDGKSLDQHAQASKDLSADELAEYLNRYRFTKSEMAAIDSRQRALNPLYRDEPFRIDHGSRLTSAALRQKLIDDRRKRHAARDAVTDVQRSSADWLDAEAAKWPADSDPDARNARRAVGRVADALREGYIDEDGAGNALSATAYMVLRGFQKYGPQVHLSEQMHDRAERNRVALANKPTVRADWAVLLRAFQPTQPNQLRET